MNLSNKVGTFNVIDSFTIRRKNEFYLIGELLEGRIEENMYINIQMNSSLVFSAKINILENIEIANDAKIYKLIIVQSTDYELNDILFCLNVGSENIYLTTTGNE
jgi:hypothetical protein